MRFAHPTPVFCRFFLWALSPFHIFLLSPLFFLSPETLGSLSFFSFFCFLHLCLDTYHAILFLPSEWVVTPLGRPQFGPPHVLRRYTTLLPFTAPLDFSLSHLLFLPIVISVVRPHVPLCFSAIPVFLHCNP